MDNPKTTILNSLTTLFAALAVYVNDEHGIARVVFGSLAAITHVLAGYHTADAAKGAIPNASQEQSTGTGNGIPVQ